MLWSRPASRRINACMATTAPGTAALMDEEAFVPPAEECASGVRRRFEERMGRVPLTTRRGGQPSPTQQRQWQIDRAPLLGGMPLDGAQLAARFASRKWAARRSRWARSPIPLEPGADQSSIEQVGQRCERGRSSLADLEKRESSIARCCARHRRCSGRAIRPTPKGAGFLLEKRYVGWPG